MLDGMPCSIKVFTFSAFAVAGFIYRRGGGNAIDERAKRAKLVSSFVLSRAYRDDSLPADESILEVCRAEILESLLRGLKDADPRLPW